MSDSRCRIAYGDDNFCNRQLRTGPDRMETAAARILLVDDEPQLLHMMKSYLIRLGYEVAPFGGAEEAWRHFEQDPGQWRLAIIDMTVGGMGGQELARRIL